MFNNTSNKQKAALLREYFQKLRNDEKHHFGLGDIRLTIAEQEECCDLVYMEEQKLQSMDKESILQEAIDLLGEINSDIKYCPSSLRKKHEFYNIKREFRKYLQFVRIVEIITYKFPGICFDEETQQSSLFALYDSYQKCKKDISELNEKINNEIEEGGYNHETAYYYYVGSSKFTHSLAIEYEDYKQRKYHIPFMNYLVNTYKKTARVFSDEELIKELTKNDIEFNFGAHDIIIRNFEPQVTKDVDFTEVEQKIDKLKFYLEKIEKIKYYYLTLI